MVGDAAAIFAEPAAQLGLSQAQLAHQGAIGLGPVDRVEVLALDVFDQGHLGLRETVDLANEGRDGGEPGELRARQRRSPAMSWYFSPTLRTTIG